MHTRQSVTRVVVVASQALRSDYDVVSPQTPNIDSIELERATRGPKSYARVQRCMTGGLWMPDSTAADAERSIGEYIENFYNVERLHSHRDYVSPIAI